MRFLILFSLLTSVYAVASEPFILAGVQIEPGTQKSFMLPAPGSQLPVTVIHGSQEGAVLTLTAGVHGDEYPPYSRCNVCVIHLTPRSFPALLY
jgi:uncharacterized protein